MIGSKRLAQAMAAGRVVIRNPTAGEVNLQLRGDDGDRVVIIVGPYAMEEISPKYVSIKALKMAKNLEKNLTTRRLKVL